MTPQEITSNIRERLGIETLKPMQLEMLHSASNRVMLIAPTGSGKTIAFCAYLLERVGKPAGTVQAVVLTPSRELTLQVAEVMRKMAVGLKTVAFYGGHSMEDEKKSLSAVPDIIVATPGRLVDHLQRATLSLEQATTLVIDEYDKCLELGFEAEMKKIVKRMTGVKNLCLTSATTLAEWPSYLPKEGWTTLDYAAAGAPAAGKLQLVEVPSTSRDKLDTLEALLRSLPDGRVMVFVNHRESAQRVYDTLKKAGFPVGIYHGALDQYQREAALEMLNNSSTPILVTTDLASRGIDIAGMDAVVHYHIPLTPEAWVHRNGRTARNGADGTVYVIVSEADTIPDYVETQRSWSPRGDAPMQIHAHNATLHLNLGKKEKISKKDILGYLVANTPLEASQIGRIMLADHYALVAVDAALAKEAVEALKGVKLKNQRVRCGLCTGA